METNDPLARPTRADLGSAEAQDATGVHRAPGHSYSAPTLARLRAPSNTSGKPVAGPETTGTTGQSVAPS